MSPPSAARDGVPRIGLQRVIRGFLAIFLAIVVVFLVLSILSYREFIGFIDNEQRTGIELGRAYEALMVRWNEFSLRRTEAYRDGVAMAVEVEQSHRKALDEAGQQLETLTAGTQWEPRWRMIASTLASWSASVTEFNAVARERTAEAIQPGGPRLQAMIRDLDALLLTIATASQVLQERPPDQQHLTASESAAIAEGLAALAESCRAFGNLMSSGRIHRSTLDQLGPIEESFDEALATLREVVWSEEGLTRPSSAPIFDVIDDLGTQAELFYDRFRRHLVGPLSVVRRMHSLDTTLRTLRIYGLAQCIEASDAIWVVIERDAAQLKERIRTRFAIRFAFLLVSLLISAAGLALLPTLIGRPLVRLRAALLALEPGAAAPPLEPSPIDEIEDLNRSFSEMARRINEDTHLYRQSIEMLARLPEALSGLRASRAAHPDREAASILSSSIETLLGLLGDQISSVDWAGVVQPDSGGGLLVCRPFQRHASKDSEGNLPAPDRSTDLAIPADAAQLLATPDRWRTLDELIETGTTTWSTVLQFPPSPSTTVDPRDPHPGRDTKIPSAAPADAPSTDRAHGVAPWMAVRLSQPRPVRDRPFVPGTEPVLLLRFASGLPGLSRIETMMLSILGHQVLAVWNTAALMLMSRQQQDLDQQLQIAREIQTATLPTRLPTMPGLIIDASVRMAHAVGGDYYDLFALDANRLGVVIADVAGKSISAALVTMMLKTSLVAMPSLLGDPALLLTELNRLLRHMLHEGVFVTFFAGCIDRKHGCLTFANAGHLPPIIVPTASPKTEPREVRVPGLPLGLRNGWRYDAHSIPLTVGDSLVLYTDGVTDARNPQGARFGSDRLLAECQHGGRGLFTRLLHRLDQFRAGTTPPDDEALIVIEVTPL